MSLQKLNFVPFFAPVDTTAGAIEDKKISTEDAIELLGVDDAEPEIIELEKAPKKDTKDEDEGTKEGDEKEEKTKSLEEEIEEELRDEEPKDEEEFELITPVRRKEILAKYPDVFKDFPYLEKAYYREQQYSEILPTIDDAKEAVEKAETLDSFESEIMQGSTESLLATVKENDKEAFAKVVDNYLPTLYKVDQDAYFHTIGNIIKHTVISMVRDGKEQEVKELIDAADVLNQYIFGTKQFHHPTRLSKAEATGNTEQEELEQQRVEFREQQYETAKDNVVSRIDNVIKSTIDKNIDPRGSMTSYVKSKAVGDVSEALENLISKDKRFVEIYDRLWERAFNDNFSTESMDRIKSAWLSKAKTLLPSLIKNARNEALRGSGKRVADDDTDEKDRRGHAPVGKTRSSASSQNSGNKTGSAKDIPKGMTSFEFLMKE